MDMIWYDTDGIISEIFQRNCWFAYPRQVKALLTLAWLNMGKMEDLGAVETALKNATEASLAKIHTGLNSLEAAEATFFTWAMWPCSHWEVSQERYFAGVWQQTNRGRAGAWQKAPTFTTLQIALWICLEWVSHGLSCVCQLVSDFIFSLHS